MKIKIKEGKLELRVSRNEAKLITRLTTSTLLNGDEFEVEMRLAKPGDTYTLESASETIFENPLGPGMIAGIEWKPGYTYTLESVFESHLWPENPNELATVKLLPFG